LEALKLGADSGGSLGPLLHAGSLENATLFLAADEKVLKATFEGRPSAECALIALELLRSAITLGIRRQSRVLQRLMTVFAEDAVSAPLIPRSASDSV
jgi:hypothetical protein